MRVLITGASGMLGQDLAREATVAGHDVLALSREELDITDSTAVQHVIGSAEAEAIFNCAAWTDVDGAETSFEAALAVNGAAAGTIAHAAAKSGAWMIHVSSDYVFDGRKREPYVESDPVDPLSAYGKSKLAGELEVAEQAPGGHTVVRSSWLFGAGGRCFPATILRMGTERDELTVVDDQIGCPTFTGHLAQALVQIASERPAGIVHVSGGGSCSWCELAREVLDAGGVKCEVRPGRTADLDRPAARPAYSVLGTERGAEAPRLPHWRQGVSEYLAVDVRAA